MEHTLRYSLFLLFCILNFVCLSTQYGQVFVDQINPALTNETFFTSITSDNATVGDLNVQTLSISHPEGLIAQIPGSLGFGGSDHTIVGKLGVTLGSVNTQTVDLNAGDSITSLSQAFDIRTDDAYIRSHGNMLFQSTRGVNFRSDVFNLEGLFGTKISSAEENVEISSGVEVSSHSEKISISAEDQLFVQSQSGSVEIESSQEVVATSDTISLQGLLGAQIVADGNITVYAEDLFLGYSAESRVSSFTTTTLTSPQNVDFTAADTLLVAAGDSASISAVSELYVSAHGDVGSSVTLISAQDIDLSIDDAAFFSAFTIHFDSVQQTHNTSVLSFTSTERFSVGSDGTQSIFIDSPLNAVQFSLSPNADNDLQVNAFFTNLTSTDSSEVKSSADVKVVASNIKTQANDLSFTADTFQAYALTSNGRLIFDSVDGATYTGGVLNMGARDEVFIGSQFVATTFTSSISAEFVQDLSFTASSNIAITAGRLTTNSYDTRLYGDSLLSITSTNSAALSISTVIGDMIFTADYYTLFSARGPLSFTSKRGSIESNGLSSVTFIASNALLTSSFTSQDDTSFVSYGDQFFVSFQDNLNFGLSPVNAEGNHLASFVTGLDFTFSSTTLNANANDALLYSTGYDMTINSLGPVYLFSKDILFKTFSNQPSAGIFFKAGNTISFTANSTISFDSANALTFSAKYWNWYTTDTVTVTSSQSINFGGNNDFEVLATTFSVLSDGELTINTVNSDSTLTTTYGDLTFSAADNLVQIGSDLFATSNDQIQFNGGEVDFTAIGSIVTTLTSNFTMTTSLPGSNITLTSVRGNTGLFDASMDFSAASLYSYSSDTFTSSTDITQILSHEISIKGREYHLTANDYTLTASSIDVQTDKYQSSYSATSDQATFSAGQEVAFTSEGNLAWHVLSGDITVTTHDLHLAASNSEGFYSKGDVNFFAFRGANDIEILANGGTSLSAADQLTINSDNTMLWKAQRSLIFRSFLDGIFLFAEDGNFLVDSAANILYEASDSVDMIAYNPDATASANFISKNGMLLETDRNGIYFKSEGFTPNSTDSIHIESSAHQGDIHFTSNDGSIFITCPGPVTFTTYGKMNLISAYTSTYTSNYNMDFAAANGGFNFNGLTGVSIIAGSNGNFPNLYFNQPLAFRALARSEINIHSLGPLTGNAIEIKSLNGSIQFVTSDASDIFLTATSDQTFTGGRSYTIESNEDISAVTPSGPIIFLAQTNGQFITEGGPIQLTTQTGSPGGNINIDAINDNITFTSGNSVFFAAKQQYSLTAATDISFSSTDGSLTVAADSAASYIAFNATGYIQITSTGTRTTPEDGVYFEAANNVEVGTPATDTISFNENQYFIIGDVSRPLVTINAGGSPTVTGLSITSDGAINATTENVFNLHANGEFIYSGASYLTSYSDGPSTISSTGTGGLGEDITFISDIGSILFEGDVTNFRAPKGISAVATSNLNIHQFGDTRSNKIRFNALSSSVTFEDVGNFLWFGNEVDAVLTDTFSLTTKGDGAIDGRTGSKGSMYFRANNLFTITSGDLLNFENQRSFGSITFATVPPANATSATPPMLIQSDTDSSIYVTSAADLNIAGDTSSFTAGDRIIFEAQDAIPNVNEPKGDIDFYTSGTMNVTSHSSVSFTTQNDINILSTFYSLNQGSPISFAASDDLNIDAALDITLQNQWNEGGSIEFQALSNINIQNGEINPQDITFTADGGSTVTAQRDYTLLADSFNGVVGGDLNFIASGIDSVDDFGIQFLTETTANGIDFRSLFGTVLFNAGSALTITADESAISNIVSDLTIESKLDGFASAVNDVTIDASGNLVTSSVEGSVYIASQGGALFSTVLTPSVLSITTVGVDDNGLYGAKFDSQATGAVLEVTTNYGPMSVQTEGPFVLQGDFVSVSTFKEVDFISNMGDILVDSMLNTTFFSYNNVVITASREIEFVSAGTIYTNSDGDISFTSANNEISLRSTGTDAYLYMYSSGFFQFTSTSYFFARSAELPGSDVNITTSLAHIEITASSTIPGVSLEIFSSYGPLSFLLPGDDTDFYIESTQNIEVQADGDIVFQSQFTKAGTGTPGVIIGVNTAFSVVSNHLALRANDIQINSNGAFYVYGQSTDNIGGAITYYGIGDLTLTSKNDIFITAKGLGHADVIFASEKSDINFKGPVTISSDSIMKVPYNNYPGESDFLGHYKPKQCFNGEVFYISNIEVSGMKQAHASNGYFCYCLNQHLHCSVFHYEPGGAYYWKGKLFQQIYG